MTVDGEERLNVEVRRNAFRWAVFLYVTENVWSPLASYRSKHDAVTVAKFYCKLRAEQTNTVELIIKNRVGRIAEKNTYGYDPESSKG